MDSTSLSFGFCSSKTAPSGDVNWSQSSGVLTPCFVLFVMKNVKTFFPSGVERSQTLFASFTSATDVPLHFQNRSAKNPSVFHRL